jgi:hypothetical protein
MQELSNKAAKTKRSWQGFVIGTTLFIAVVVLLVISLPRGFDTDLNKIGGDKPSLVLVFDPNLVASGEMMRVLNEIRPEFKSKLQFLVADIGRVEAQQFAQQYQVRPSTVLIFATSGQPLKVLAHAPSAKELTGEIQSALGW